MDANQHRVLLAFRRVVNFVDGRPELTVDSTVEGRGLKARVDALKGVVERLNDQVVSQHEFAVRITRIPTEGKELKRSLVDHHLRSIAKAAKALRGTVPGIGVLKMPSRSDRNARLIDEASTFAKQAEIYQEVLVEQGLPSDVIAQLNAAIDRFRTSIDARGTARSELRGSTTAIRTEIALGRAIVEGLDGVVPRALHASQQDLEAWRVAKRVGRGTVSAQSGRSDGSSNAVAVGSVDPQAGSAHPVGESSQVIGQSSTPGVATSLAAAQRAA